MFFKRLVVCVSFFALSVLLSSCQMQTAMDPVTEARMGIESADPVMGDWEGRWNLDDGSDSGSVVAQVIALGGGKYRANVMTEFDTREKPIAVLDGRRDGIFLRFEGPGEFEYNEFKIKAIIQDGKFKGTFTGDASGNAVLR